MSKGKYKKKGNSNLSKGMEDIVPQKYKGTDSFLDICCWNIRYFHDRDEKRVEKVSSVIEALNADIFVLQEIMENSLESVVKKLQKSEAGHYTAAYGTTGGDQRVAMMYDLDWVRAKMDFSELFGAGQILTDDGKDAFPRLPLYAYFTCLANGSTEPFDFNLVGVHLKSQRGKGRSVNQRVKAAETLSNWLINNAQKIDSDVILTGDFNETPDADTWESFKMLEKKGKILFESINDKSEISHLMYKNISNIGSRLDLSVVSMASASKMVDKKANVVKWKSLDDILNSHPKADEIRDNIQDISNNISDHMPVITRFYFKEKVTI